MAIDFPAGPTNGQEFTPPGSGIIWTWDGIKWTAGVGSSVGYLPLAGGTLTGPVNSTSTFELIDAPNFILGGGVSGDALTTDGLGGLSWGPISGGATISDTPPLAPEEGDLWWDSLGGQLYVWFNDGNSAQWVAAASTPTGPAGPQGAPGATGATGATGAPGAPGPNTLPPGVTDGSNAVAGQIGEFLSASNTTGSPVTSTVRSNVVSIALPAGDWDVWGAVYFALSAGSSTNMQGWISPISNSLPPGYGGVPGTAILVGSGFTNGCQLNTGTARYSLTATTTIYLGVYNNFTGGTCTATGTIMARRAR
jgi:hypothetical protein